MNLLQSLYPPEVVPNISKPPISHHLQDILVWSAASSGEYSVAKGYDFLVQNDSHFIQNMQHLIQVSTSFPWKYFWSLKLPIRLLLFIWKLRIGALSSIDNLSKHHFNIDGNRVFCNQVNETADHIFLLCDFEKSVVWK